MRLAFLAMRADVVGCRNKGTMVARYSGGSEAFRERLKGSAMPLPGGRLLLVLLLFALGIRGAWGQTNPGNITVSTESASCSQYATVKVKVTGGEPPYRVFCGNPGGANGGQLRILNFDGAVAEFIVGVDPVNTNTLRVAAYDAHALIKELTSIQISPHATAPYPVKINVLKSSGPQYNEGEAEFELEGWSAGSGSFTYSLRNFLGEEVLGGSYDGGITKLQNLNKGMYTLLIEGNGCKTSASFEVGGIPFFEMVEPVIQHPSSNVKEDGSITCSLKFPYEEVPPDLNVEYRVIDANSSALVKAVQGKSNIPVTVNGLGEGVYKVQCTLTGAGGSGSREVGWDNPLDLSSARIELKEVVQPSCSEPGSIKIAYTDFASSFFLRIVGDGQEKWIPVDKSTGTPNPLLVEGLTVKATSSFAPYTVEAWYNKRNQYDYVNPVSFELYPYVSPELDVKPIEPSCAGKSDGGLQVTLVKLSRASVVKHKVGVYDASGTLLKELEGNNIIHFNGLKAGKYTVKAESTHATPCPTDPPEASVEIKDPPPIQLLYQHENVEASCNDPKAQLVVDKLQGLRIEDSKMEVILTPTTSGTVSPVTRNYSRDPNSSKWDFADTPLEVDKGVEYQVSVKLNGGGPGGIGECTMVSSTFILEPQFSISENIKCHGEDGDLRIELIKGEVKSLQLKDGALPKATYVEVQPATTGSVTLYPYGSKVKEGFSCNLRWATDGQQSSDKGADTRYTEGCKFEVPTIDEFVIEPISSTGDPITAANMVGECGKASNVTIKFTGGVPFSTPNPYWFDKSQPTPAPQSGNVSNPHELSIVKGDDKYYAYDSRGCVRELDFTPLVKKPFSFTVNFTQQRCANSDFLDPSLMGATDPGCVVHCSQDGEYDVNMFKVGLPDPLVSLSKQPCDPNTSIEIPSQSFNTLKPGDEFMLKVSLSSDPTCEMESDPQTFTVPGEEMDGTLISLTHEGVTGKWCNTPPDYGYRELVVSELKGDQGPYTLCVKNNSSVPKVTIGADEALKGVKNVKILAAADAPFLPQAYEVLIQSKNENCDYLFKHEIPNLKPLTVTPDFKAEVCASPNGEVGKLNAIAAEGGDPWNDPTRGVYLKYYLAPLDAKFDASHAGDELALSGTPSFSPRVLTSDELQLFVFDRQGCNVSKELGVGMVVPKDLRFSITPRMPICNGEPTGSLYVNCKAKDILYVLYDKATGKLYDDQVGPQTHGIFHGLLGDKEYRIKVKDLKSGCDNTREFKLDNPPAINIDLPSFSTPLACPDSYHENVEAKVSGGSGSFISYQWVWEEGNPVERKNLFTQTPVLPRAYAKPYTFIVTDSEGCRVSKELTVSGNPPYVLSYSATEAPCKGVDASTGQPSLGSFTVTSFSGGGDPSPHVFWTTEVGALTKGTEIQLNTPYNVPAGTYMVQVKDNANCESLHPVEVKFNRANSVDFGFAPNLPNSVCYGDPYKGIKLVENSGSPVQLDLSKVKMECVANYLQPAKSAKMEVVSDAPGSFATKQGITSISLLKAMVQTGSCMDIATFEISPFSNQQLKFFPEESHVGVIYNREVVDKERSSADGTSYVVYRDSLALGLLSDSPAEISIRPKLGLLPGRTITFQPPEFYTSEGRTKFTVQLPPDASRDPKYETVKREVNGKEFTFIRTKAILSNRTNGCTSSLDIWLRVIDNLRIPNVFTPNGDGVNDRWLNNSDPTYATLFTRLNDILPDIEVEVFTRAGLPVWKAKGAEVAQGWDGRARWGGQELPVGTYYYVIKFNVQDSNGTWKPVSGSVTIIR